MSKIIRDPLHDLIRIDDPTILELIDSQPMQRLRKIRQLGLACLVFPGAEHSRFVHSLGVFHLSQQVADYLGRIQLPDKKFTHLDEKRKKLLGFTALLHDVGHGPFSHLFERIARATLDNQYISHEDWTIQIIRKHPTVSKILNSVDEKVIDSIHQILTHTYSPRYIGDIISSQFDVDRFDYLLRDSLMTGAKYGNFDLAWILRALKIGFVNENNNSKSPEIQVLAIDGKRGLNWVEMHLLGRHYMYKNVYYHKTIRAAESMLKVILSRVIDLIRINKLTSPHPVMSAFAEKKQPSLDEYLSLNDFTVLDWIEEWANKCNDKILEDLSNRLYTRNIFKTITIRDKKTFSRISDVKNFLKKKGYEPDYYLLEDEPRDVVYKDYLWYMRKGGDPNSRQEIYILDENKKTIPLSNVGGFLTEADKSLSFEDDRWYVPGELKEEIMSIIE